MRFFKGCKFIKNSAQILCFKMNYIVKLLLISKIKLHITYIITIFKHLYIIVYIIVQNVVMDK
jgi:hypothetical protein